MWRGPLACVARDQIRDQISDQQRLSCPASSQTERRFGIRGTCWDASGHLRRGRRVETQRSHPGPGRQVFWSATLQLEARLMRTAASPCLRPLRSGPWPQADPRAGTLCGTYVCRSLSRSRCPRHHCPG